MFADTEHRATVLRRKGIDLADKKVLITKFEGSQQEADLSEPPNCGGLGRLRHFRRATSIGWPSNPLPIDPARNALGLKPSDEILAQAFQDAICDWRCWYCYVPFEMLSANQRHSEWVTASELVDRFSLDDRRAPMIDLTGGQPDLVPEWTLWMMEALIERGLSETTYIWVDDNLSSDYFWRFLSGDQIDFIQSYPKYGRVGCFKGFDSESFSFNTAAKPELFDRQFEIFARHLASGVDCYAYVTLTTPSGNGIDAKMGQFLDRLQGISENLPLRTVPLEIVKWGPVDHRLNDERKAALSLQYQAVEAWQREVARRFTAEMRALPIHDVPVR